MSNPLSSSIPIVKTTSYKATIESLLHLPFFISIQEDLKEKDLSPLEPLFEFFIAKKSLRYFLNGQCYYFLISGSLVMLGQEITGCAGPIHVINKKPQEIFISLTSECHFASIKAKKLDHYTSSVSTAKIKAFIQEIRKFNPFKHLNWRTYENLYRYMHKHTYHKGDEVLREGQSPSGVFFIKKGLFRLIKKNHRRIAEDQDEQLDLVNKELLCSKKEDMLLSQCLNDNISPSSYRVSSLKREIEQLKSKISVKKEKPNKGFMTLLILEEPNIFGDIEFINELTTVHYSVICLSQTAEVYLITNAELRRTLSDGMLAVMANEVTAKCALLYDKYHSDVIIHIKRTHSRDYIRPEQLTNHCTRHDFALNSRPDRDWNSKKPRSNCDKPLPHLMVKSTSMLLPNKARRDNKRSTEVVEANDKAGLNRIQMKKFTKYLSDSNIDALSLRNPQAPTLFRHHPLHTQRKASIDLQDKRRYQRNNCFSETVMFNRDVMKEQKNQYMRTGIKLPMQKKEMRNKVTFNFFQSSMKSLLLEVNPLSVDFVH